MGGEAVRFVGRLLAALILLPAGIAAAAAEDFHTPALAVVHVDWRAALDQLRTELGTAPVVASNFAFSRGRRVPRFDPRSMPALVQLNGATSPIFIGITRSQVPVLLPFDAAAYIGAGLNGEPAAASLSRYQADFAAVDFFDL